MKTTRQFWQRKASATAVSLALVAGFQATAWAEGLTILHIGDQESWLISAQGNLRDSASQKVSFYGGVDRLATVIANRKAAAAGTVITLNAGDSVLPGPRLNASFVNLATAAPDGGQDFYDAIANRLIGVDATTFGNHEFDLDNTGPVAARFAEVSGTTYLSANLDFSATQELAALETSGKVAASKIITTAGGKKVGIVGATTPLLPGISSPPVGLMKNWSPTNTAEQNLAAIIPLVQAEIDDLRNNQGVSVIIVMSHLQNAANEINTLVPGLRGVDLVISGGGHELMSDPDDALIVDFGAPVIAPTFNTHPVSSNDADGKAVPVVTGHFGNRYVGELKFTINDATGAVASLDSSRMIRVSGYSNVDHDNKPETSPLSDADAVAGDVNIKAQVVDPVLAYVADLNTQVIGTTATKLNGPTHTACTPVPPATNCVFNEGVRNAETGLGNLVADAMRFAGQTDVAIQNGGGIRATITKPGNFTVGDTFNILTFTNLVKVAPVMNATQLKDILEHSVIASDAKGSNNGRFAQVSGMKVTYNSSLTKRASTSANDPTPVGSGDRIRRVVLDDGTVLIDNGAVVNAERTFSFTTIDFTANGGDGYPFAANGVAFENRPFTITYQEALANYIQAPKANGGLQRLNLADGDEITVNMYGEENAFDLHGRLVDVNVGQALVGKTFNGTAARNTIVGTVDDDRINGGAGADLLTGGAGGDQFIYTSIRDLGDVITDFTPYADKLDLSALLGSLGVQGNGSDTGHIRFADTTGGVQVLLDTDGKKGPAVARPFITLKGLTAAQMAPARDFIGNGAAPL
ncbi:MAG: alkaline phosphatase [Rhodoferax ferrireducens]|uniref:Alkaline phosphatase n=1 Tax=Rhodoferax ferrireducens TaxID=192843 RepID=A0A1W9KPC6_9BURK|nr:MAG: alkaline phosphatase [Rhodoferax ferrireducens]